MFHRSENICKKIKESGCINDNELQYVEMGLKMIDCYNEMLNQNLGLDLHSNEKLDIDFKLQHAIQRNAYLKMQGMEQPQ